MKLLLAGQHYYGKRGLAYSRCLISYLISGYTCLLIDLCLVWYSLTFLLEYCFNCTSSVLIYLEGTRTAQYSALKPVSGTLQLKMRRIQESDWTSTGWRAHAFLPLPLHKHGTAGLLQPLLLSDGLPSSFIHSLTQIKIQCCCLA